jgi:hypothetical protein
MYFVPMSKKEFFPLFCNYSVYFSTSFDDLYLYPAYNSMGAYSFFICPIVCPIALCECNTSEVVDPIAFMFGHDVYLTILSRHFDSIIFAGVMGLSL